MYGRGNIPRSVLTLLLYSHLVRCQGVEMTRFYLRSRLFACYSVRDARSTRCSACELTRTDATAFLPAPITQRCRAPAPCLHAAMSRCRAVPPRCCVALPSYRKAPALACASPLRDVALQAPAGRARSSTQPCRAPAGVGACTRDVAPRERESDVEALLRRPRGALGALLRRSPERTSIGTNAGYDVPC